MHITLPKDSAAWHHAYVVPGGSAADITQALAAAGIAAVGNANVSVRTQQVFSVADARAVRERASHFAGGGAQQFFVIDCADMTTEAQNALLKLFEEPTGRAMFFVALPSLAMLLPTLRSRMQVLTPTPKGIHGREETSERATGATGALSAFDFLTADKRERLELVKKLLPKKKTDERDLRGILIFLAELEHEIAALPEPEQRAQGLRALYRTRRYITDRGASHKILLEQVALLVPEHKA